MIQHLLFFIKLYMIIKRQDTYALSIFTNTNNLDSILIFNFTDEIVFETDIQVHKSC